MMNTGNWLKTSWVFGICLFVCVRSNETMAAESESSTWMVQIDLFSGRPNPVLTLDDNAVARVRAFMAQASSVTESRDAATVFPAALGYRGLIIKETKQIGDKKTVQSTTRIRGTKVLVEKGQERSWLEARDTSLERFLLDLALAKKALSAELHTQIQDEIKKR